MSASAKINQIRRSLMRGLTKKIGCEYTIRNIDLKEKPPVRRILISRPNNRLGNLLLITPLIQDISETLPDCKIDLFVRGGLAPVLFKNYPAVDRIIKLPGKPFKHLIDYTGAWLKIKSRRYDIVINVILNSSSGRLSTKFARSRFKIYGDVSAEVQATHEDFRHTAKYPVYNFREFMAMLGYGQNGNAVPVLDIKLTRQEREAGKVLLESLADASKKTICLFTYATGGKCFAPLWWEPFYERLKAEFPQYNIIEVLPLENVSQIGFKAPSYYGKDIRELGAVIAAADVFIGADSGIMHLASAVQTPTVGLFHVTDPAAFGPYGNHSTAIDTSHSSSDDLISVVRNILESKA